MADWLFSSGGCSYPHDFREGPQVRFRHGQVRSFVEETQVLPGIWLYRGEAAGRCRFSIRVDGTGKPRDGGRLVMGAMLAGRGALGLDGQADQFWREDGRFYALAPVERRVRYEVEAEQGWRAVALRLEREALDMLGGDQGVPEMVRSALEGRRHDFSETAPLSGALRSLGHLLLRPAYSGAMHRLFQQAKTLEFLAHQFDLISLESVSGFTSAELARVRRARDQLLADLRDPPDLHTLAAGAEMSAKRLNRGFRSLYGTTVFDYLRDARLDAARAALEAGTPLSLKSLAWELGYGQVSNFSTAFSRRFGVPPGAYRDTRR